MKLWQKGLIVFAVGILLNGIMLSFDVHGLLRELTRLTTLVGLGITIFGAITKK